MGAWSSFGGINEGYLWELYERYRDRPDAVDEATRAFFDRHPLDDRLGSRAITEDGVERVVCAVRLADAIRHYGHRAARLDPLGQEPPGDDALELDTYSLSEDDLERLPSSFIGGSVARRTKTAKEAIAALREIYCGSRGYDFGHIHEPGERNWLLATTESGRFRPPHDPVDALELLKCLSSVEAFEQFLHRTFPGKFRFSIEGLDMLVPLLDELTGAAAEEGIRSLLLGMAHRGRLNVLAHVLEKPYGAILAELADYDGTSKFDEAGFTGDVTYHLGARRAERRNETVALVITMPPNPSHVEAIDPVIQGMARAAGCRVDDGGPPKLEPQSTLPVLIHGDAAFPGQGVVAETLNLSRLPGYGTGGTIHVIANNQLGFTTEPEEAYSTTYASDLAKGFDLPVIHVNADEPEACIEAVRTGFAYLRRFHKDFVIDLVGYRRRGHNESDEPSFTQPLRYRKIEAHPSVREKWARELVERGTVDEDEPEQIFDAAMDRLRDEWNESRNRKPPLRPEPVVRSRPEAPRGVTTKVPLDRLRELNDSLLVLPDGFELHSKLEKTRRKRRELLAEPDEETVDWATAEELALATILSDGIAVRLTGQDCERGTFSQRHAVFHDAETGAQYIPLQAFSEAEAAFEIENSPLTENAALGFEMGYNFHAPERLTIWEAQYGDFINNAQMVVDEFLTSARAKWGVEPTLVLLLPHGQEGHGPDHSTGRLERFLSLAAGENVRLANCTTAAQYFHLLRLHAKLLEEDPLPLVVFTPKTLLRHPRARSRPRELAEASFERVLVDGRREKEVRRLLLVTGKVYVDLVEAEPYQEREDVAICRLEQLYPFPREPLEDVLARYPRLEDVRWVQEEPANMGAWPFMKMRLVELLPEGVPLGYVGRPESPSPAEGSHARHRQSQEALVAEAFREKGAKEPAGVRVQHTVGNKELSR